jgi:SAM-dependent methyltransferase
MPREPRDKKHWEAIYSGKAPDRVSWYRPHLDRSLRFLDATRIASTAAVIDVGGGTSTFVDDLLDRGYSNLTVLDLSPTALETARARLGDRASRVKWICADVTHADLPERAYDFWHDRAVFHFLTDPAARSRYVDAVRRSLRPGGHIVVATFGPHGPEKCSGLEVLRFTADSLHAEFGEDFAKIADSTEIHNTPWGSEQEFVYCYCRLPI